ncbi:hypothetical protein ACIQB5_21630 [Streptomyces sp. NPDC088560]|uniref:hypothetical protein n=1 Tax=Streptomyces sp. NPDC088560 TaxID=3365868 RepID=UPI00382D3FB5
MPARRPARIALAAVAVALLSVTASGCGDRGALRAAGPTPTAVSPAKLWPDLRPASSPAYPYDVATRSLVKGIKVPGDDIRKVNPVDVVEAEIRSEPDDYGSKGAYHGTVDRLKDCRPGGDEARCPLLKPYYRDLTGDGKDDLTLGFRLYPTNQTAVRVYTVEKHRLVQVLADNDAILGVELAGRALIERSPADISGYEYRTTWVWDPGQRAMVFSRDEYLHTGDGRKATKPSRSAAPSASPSARSSTPASAPASSPPSATPSAGTS